MKQYVRFMAVFEILGIWLLLQKSHSISARRMKIDMLHFGAENVDASYVKSFSRWNSTSDVYVLNVVKGTSLIFVDVFVTNLDSKRSLYKIVNKDGCDILNNIMISKFFRSFYDQLVLNGSEFKCPLKAQKVYLRNAFTADIIPTIHPSGRFELKVGLKPKPDAKSLLVLVWRYKVAH